MRRYVKANRRNKIRSWTFFPKRKIEDDSPTQTKEENRREGKKKMKSSACSKMLGVNKRGGEINEKGGTVHKLKERGEPKPRQMSAGVEKRPRFNLQTWKGG